jgi:hypothetical protein
MTIKHFPQGPIKLFSSTKWTLQTIQVETPDLREPLNIFTQTQQLLQFPFSLTGILILQDTLELLLPLSIHMRVSFHLAMAQPLQHIVKERPILRFH